MFATFHRTFTAFSPHIHRMFTACSPYVHCMSTGNRAFSRILTIRPMRTSSIGWTLVRTPSKIRFWCRWCPPTYSAVTTFLPVPRCEIERVPRGPCSLLVLQWYRRQWSGTAVVPPKWYRSRTEVVPPTWQWSGTTVVPPMWYRSGTEVVPSKRTEVVLKWYRSGTTSGTLNLKTSESQNLRISRFQNLWLSESGNLRISESQKRISLILKISTSRNLRSWKSQNLGS